MRFIIKASLFLKKQIWRICFNVEIQKKNPEAYSLVAEDVFNICCYLVILSVHMNKKGYPEEQVVFICKAKSFGYTSYLPKYAVLIPSSETFRTKKSVG